MNLHFLQLIFLERDSSKKKELVYKFTVEKKALELVIPNEKCKTCVCVCVCVCT